MRVIAVEKNVIFISNLMSLSLCTNVFVCSVYSMLFKCIHHSISTNNLAVPRGYVWHCYGTSAYHHPSAAQLPPDLCSDSMGGTCSKLCFLRSANCVMLCHVEAVAPPLRDLAAASAAARHFSISVLKFLSVPCQVKSQARIGKTKLPWASTSETAPRNCRTKK